MNKKILLLFFFAFALRLILVPVAHHGDLNNNISWGQELLSRGINGFYGSSDANEWPYSAPNQPPLYLLMFGLIVWIFNILKSFIWWLNSSVGIFPSSIVWWWEMNGMDLMVKMPGILADLGIGILIYKFFAMKDQKKALLISSIWLFNPVTWYSSGIWGQTDSVVNLLGLLSVFSLLGYLGNANNKMRRFTWFCVLFNLSFLYKPSLAIFIPILTIVILKQKNSFKEYLLAAFYVLLATFLISFWFHPYLDFPIWLFDLYKNRILPGEIGYLTANAFNFWWLVDSGKTLDSVVYFGLTARVWGLVGAITGIGGVAYWLNKNLPNVDSISKKKMLKQAQYDRIVFFSLAAVSFVSFLFMTRIHERYLYPFFPYATFLLGFVPSTWILYIAISTVHLLNLYHLFWAPPVHLLEKLYQNNWFANSLSLLTLILFPVFVFKFLSRPKEREPLK